MSTIFYKKVTIYFLSVITPIILGICISIYATNMLAASLKICLMFISVLLCVLTLFFYGSKKTKTYKILLIINVMFVFSLSLYLWLWDKNLIYIFSSVNEFKKYILATGSAGVILYIVIQLLQVVVLPIPAAVICITGALIYGPFLGSLYCAIGVILGSIISFWLGRVFGYRLVSWVVGKDSALKYANLLSKRGKTFLPMAFLLPLFPDDILCLIAGITSMKYSYFIGVVTIFRPISIFFMSYFGGGYVIPFSGWGVYIWGVIILFMVVVVYFTTKYQSAIENWIITKFNKK